jgi:hypothetical protein
MHKFIIFITAVYIVGCSDVIQGPNYDPAMIVNTQNTLQDYISNQPQLEDYDCLYELEVLQKEQPKRPAKPSGVFSDLLIKLKLSSKQKEIVSKLLIDHKACTVLCTESLRAAEKKILAEMKRQEAVIKHNLKTGEITKEQARKELVALKEASRAKLKEAQAASNIRECLKECDGKFIAELKKILTADQQAILEQWLKEREKRQSDKPRG